MLQYPYRLANTFFSESKRKQKASTYSHAFGAASQCFDDIASARDTSIYDNVALLKNLWTILAHLKQCLRRRWGAVKLTSAMVGEPGMDAMLHAQEGIFPALNALDGYGQL